MTEETTTPETKPTEETLCTLKEKLEAYIVANVPEVEDENHCIHELKALIALIKYVSPDAEQLPSA